SSQTVIHTSQLAASNCLFNPSNGFSLNDLEESWQTVISSKRNCNLALLDGLIRRDEEDSIKPLKIVDNKFVENFNKVCIEIHHLQSRSCLLHDEFQLRYRIEYFDHPIITLN
ncbi:spectrin beta chain, partial [Schistosoma japonicum]